MRIIMARTMYFRQCPVEYQTNLVYKCVQGAVSDFTTGLFTALEIYLPVITTLCLQHFQAPLLFPRGRNLASCLSLLWN